MSTSQPAQSSHQTLTLDINEVGVPQDVAMRLSVPEKVTAWNIEEMKKFVINGPENYPGALYIIRPDGKRIRLEFVVDRTKIAEAVELGFVIERHLKNGDIAIFNRQPSLHRMSIMAHYVTCFALQDLQTAPLRLSTIQRRL